MDTAALIGRVARGERGSENLNRQEAADIFARLLRPDADELQLGAFLIAQRMKGESSEELAGFVDAARAAIPGYGKVRSPESVDLPCYAGKRRAAPAHLVAALKARDAGLPVFVHGVERIEGRVTAWQTLGRAGVRRAVNLKEAAAIIASDGIAYADLGELCPDLFRLYHLRDRLGVRSFVNTVARMLNPLGSAGQLNGMFHTPYADYMAKANAMLAQSRSLIFMGAEGEPELYASRQKLVKMQVGDEISDLRFADCVSDPYPRQALPDLADIHRQFDAMLAGDGDARQKAAINRTLGALYWAAGRDELMREVSG